MTSLLSCVVATLVLGAEPDLKGLPFGIPPAAGDAVIASIAPPRCMFYLNWAGTAAPNAKSGSETEKLLAEPEVQELLNETGRLITTSLKKLNDMPSASTLESATKSSADVGGSKFSAADYGDFINVLLTHPTAIFVADIKPHVDGPGRKASSPIYTSPNLRLIQEEHERIIMPEEHPDQTGLQHSKAICATEPAPTQAAPGESQPAASSGFSAHGGMVVSLGSDAPRIRAEFSRLLKMLKTESAELGLRRVKIRGETWYRVKASSGDAANEITFGFHENYFVLGVGRRSIEGILDRWKRPMPEWLAKAMAATPVPRRTGIIYFDAQLLCKTLPLSPDCEAALKFAGLDNVRTLVSTTGLDEYGMINRVRLDIDGKPHGLIEALGRQPLSAKDVEPIPADALMAFAARFDLETLLQKCDDISGRDNNAPAGEHTAADWLTDKLKIGLTHRLCASLGDSWCLYNSPTEGEVAFYGWTAVAKVRDRAALVQCLETLSALPTGVRGVATNTALGVGTPLGVLGLPDGNSSQVKKCRFAGHDIYYLSGQAIVPALTITEHEAVATLNMPAMKAYLSRQDHRWPRSPACGWRSATLIRRRRWAIAIRRGCSIFSIR
jgi:hypothetical protein